METADRAILILKQSVSDAVLEASSFGRSGGTAFPLAWVKPARVVECARALRDQGGFTQLENLSAMQVENDVLFTYFARNPESLETAVLRASIEAKPERRIELDSVAEIWPMARPFEEEISRFFGVKIPGYPERDEWDGFPLRKTFVLAPAGSGVGGGGIDL